MSAYTTLTLSREQAINRIVSKNLEEILKQEVAKVSQLSNEELEKILDDREEFLYNYLVL